MEHVVRDVEGSEYRILRSGQEKFALTARGMNVSANSSFFTTCEVKTTPGFWLLLRIFGLEYRWLTHSYRSQVMRSNFCLAFNAML